MFQGHIALPILLRWKSMFTKIICGNIIPVTGRCIGDAIGQKWNGNTHFIPGKIFYWNHISHSAHPTPSGRKWKVVPAAASTVTMVSESNNRVLTFPNNGGIPVCRNFPVFPGLFSLATASASLLLPNSGIAHCCSCSVAPCPAINFCCHRSSQCFPHRSLRTLAPAMSRARCVLLLLIDKIRSPGNNSFNFHRYTHYHGIFTPPSVDLGSSVLNSSIHRKRRRTVIQLFVIISSNAGIILCSRVCT